MSKYSIITCISKPDIYNTCLLSSINRCRKNFDIEIIPIINNDNRLSASNALNLGIDAAKSNNLIFVHQDVKLLDDWFDALSEIIDDPPDDWGVIGSAGIGLHYDRSDIGRWGGSVHDSTVAIGTVYHSDESLNDVPYWNGIKDVTKVHCADECLFVLNKSTGLRFDAQFTGFHFYGVDICLQARSAAYGVYCANLPIIHYGQYSASFTGDKKYWVYLRHLYNKWRLQYPTMLGTHMHWTDTSDAFDYELTSYISLVLENDSGVSVSIKSMGIEHASFATDRRLHYLDDSND